MSQIPTPQKTWKGLRIGITGVSGTLGISLAKALKSKGAYIVGLTHGSISSESFVSSECLDQCIKWKCGKEKELDKIFKSLDILVLNHGVNLKESLNKDELNKALEINALSTWRLLERFEEIIFAQEAFGPPKEIWVNTSEAEIQPALSPSYEISKRLIGQLVSYKLSSHSKEEKARLRLRKLILGPFRSKLNPIGIMNADFVANQIIVQAKFPLNFIIVTPNPLTYFLIPIIEIMRDLYFKLLKIK